MFVLDEFAASNQTERADGNRIGLNQMLWDFGLDSFDDEKAIKRKIAEADEKFHLVMIVERFDESLVLMRHQLCWDLEDMISLKLNARKAQQSRIDETTRDELKKLLAADYTLYNHFLEIFDRKVQQFGKQRMEEEVRQLSTANQEVSEKCKVSAADNRDVPSNARWWGPGLVGYKVNQDSEDCGLMAMAEMSYVERLREIQNKQIEKTKET